MWWLMGLMAGTALLGRAAPADGAASMLLQRWFARLVLALVAIVLCGVLASFLPGWLWWVLIPGALLYGYTRVRRP